MKILFLTNHLARDDGWSTYSSDFIEAIQDLGHQVLVLTSRKSKQRKIRESPILREPLEYLINPLNSFLASVRINKAIKEFSPDIIHFLAEPYATILPFLKINEVRTFLTVHGTYSVTPILFNNFFKRKTSWYLSKKYYKKLDGIVAVSNYTKNYLIDYYPRLKTKIKIITNGINLKEYKIINLNRKSKNKIKKILFVGAVKERKGILEAIESCKYYHNNFSDSFIYNIVGGYDQNDKYYQEAITRIRTYNLSDMVFFLGKVSDDELKKHYLDADLFLMLSVNVNNEFEGFGLVFLEANTKGVPCIGSKDCGAQDAILNGKTGYTIDPHNFKEIAHKMNLILNKKSINTQDCIEWAKQNDIEIKVKELVNFYQGQ